MTIMTPISKVTQHLLDHGIKPSAQRLAIMRYLMDHRCHPTADDIYAALLPDNPTLSRTTVYNTLWLFAAGQAVTALSIDRNNARFDYIDTPHAHFLCRECNRVFDVPLEVTPVFAAQASGKRIEQVDVYYKGVCEHCACRDIDVS